MHKKENWLYQRARIIKDVVLRVLIILPLLLVHEVSASGIIPTLGYVQQLLMEIGPMLSAVLFIVAGIFYAIGQLLPPDKRAVFHSTSINIIIGAIIVAVLSVTSNSLALASTQLLANLTVNSIR